MTQTCRQAVTTFLNRPSSRSARRPSRLVDVEPPAKSEAGGAVQRISNAQNVQAPHRLPVLLLYRHCCESRSRVPGSVAGSLGNFFSTKTPTFIFCRDIFPIFHFFFLVLWTNRRAAPTQEGYGGTTADTHHENKTRTTKDFRRTSPGIAAIEVPTFKILFRL